MLDALAPARRRLVLGVAGLLVVALVLAGAAVVRSLSGGEETAPVSQDVPGPVLLVPGYGASGAGLAVLADRLRAAGRTVEVLALPDDGTGDLEEQAVALGDAAADLAAAEDSGAVDVVGHSAGGVVARLWVTQEDGDRLARRVVTLGSPHHGTEVADLGAGLAPDSCPEACRQLTTDSPLLADLNAGDETPDGPVWVSLWTQGDLPADDAVVAMTLAALGGVVPEAPPAATVCGG